MLNCLLFMYGASLASFAVCTAFRFKSELSLLKPRSFCDHCLHQLKWWQLLPVFGWLFQKGHCIFCGHKIAPLSATLESVYGLLFVCMNHSLQNWPFFLLESYLQLWLLILALEDHYTMNVSSRLLYLGSLPALLLAWPQVYLTIADFWLQLLLFYLLCYTFEKMNKLGHADTICLLVLMLLYGLKDGCYLLLTSTSLFLLFHFQQERKKPHAFLPFLTASFFLFKMLNAF